MDCFNLQRSAVFGFGTYADDDSGSIFKISDATLSEKADLGKTTVHNLREVFWVKTYDVCPYDSQRSHPSMTLVVKRDLCVLFVQNCCEMSGLQISLSQLYSLLF